MSSPSESVNLIEPGHQYFPVFSGGLLKLISKTPSFGR